MINSVDKLPDGITFKNAAILITCVIKGDGKFYAQISLEKLLFVK